MTRALLGTAPAGATNAVRWQDLLAQNTATMPTNGWYLPSANTLGVATNGVQRGLIGSTGGWQIGAPTGGDKGAGTLNLAGGMAGLYFNNTALQAIAPTWSALHTFSAGLSATNVSITGTGSLLQVGSTQYAWQSSQYAVDLGAGASVHADAFQGIAVDNNLYYGASGWTYKAAAGAAQFSAANGGFTWNTAGSGAANGAATLVQRMALSNTGALALSASAYAWYASFTTVDIGLGAGVFADSVGGAGLADNIYANTSGNWTYKQAGSNGGALFQATGGAYIWYTAPLSGAAGSGATLTSRMALSNTGALTVNGAAVTSDERLKTNVAPIPHALDLIKSFNGVRFDWIETGEKSAGLIAQDVERLMPELVSPGLNDRKALNYNGVIAVLVEAVKAQQIQIDTLTKGLNS